MSALTVRCIRAAFIYLAFGIGLGASFAIDRAWGVGLRMLHAELNLWGGVTLLIYGLGYHMLPRFMGRPLRWPRLAEGQSWIAIAGVALAVVGWLAQRADAAVAPVLLGSGGALQLGGAMIFALLVGRLMFVKRGVMPDS